MKDISIKLARPSLDAKPLAIGIKEIEKQVVDSGGKIFCLDRETTQKDLKALMEIFEEKGFSVFARVLKYGLDEEEYVYEVHIL